MVQRLVLVGPEDLHRTLLFLSPHPQPLPQVLEVLRRSVDEPMEALLLAEEVGLSQQVGMDIRLTPEGRAWLEAPWDPPPDLLLLLLQALPWPEALEALKAQGNAMPLAGLLPLLPEGPKGEKGARAMAEWGALLGFWDLSEERIVRR